MRFNWLKFSPWEKRVHNIIAVSQKFGHTGSFDCDLQGRKFRHRLDGESKEVGICLLMPSDFEYKKLNKFFN